MSDQFLEIRRPELDCTSSVTHALGSHRNAEAFAILMARFVLTISI